MKNDLTMKSGDKIQLKNDPRGHQYVAIMAVIDGYVMARYHNCMPFCLPVKIFERKFTQSPVFFNQQEAQQ